ncbi:MAG TPA: TetR family transcriptional regulator [Segeticoccus sp.]|uniref:TetR/AcrR family transcriptional regulator n=1 Tax=Segeticoccus sp. TaxID=2706531 RepID=UPI002D7F489A|nr:TetR family transcriptional regulator [Segeticoccus sp.]HET8601487.1 TetR family transcriptional regulator [Segeticoccus sp.]
METVGRRERKKNQTRRALREAAVELVERHGFEHVTIEQVTDAVDVSPRTFFNYYASKEEALTAADPERVAGMRAVLAQRPAEEPALEALRRAVLTSAAALAEEQVPWQRRLAIIRADPRLLAALARSWWVIERELAEGLAERLDTEPHDLVPGVLATSAVAALRVAISRWDDTSRSLPELVNDAFDVLAGAGAR